MIQILHFVNPHLFFYKFRDAGFDKPLHEMEQKIYGSVYKKSHSTESSDPADVGDTVAVFMPHSNRWVRGQVKEVSSDGTFFVWATDYGVPIISKDVVKLPEIYTKMNSKCPRVYIGGLINCTPAESMYDYETDKLVQKETPAWSKQAIEILQTAIDCAINMKFENLVEFKLMNRPGVHHFGRLACQKPDGTWTDLTKCLSNAFVAKITTDDWFNTNVYRMASVQQPEWKTNEDNPIPLDIKLVVFKNIPRTTTNDADRNGSMNASNQSIASSSMTENAGAVDTIGADGNEVTKNTANKDSSISKYGPFPSGPQTRPHMNQYAHGMKSNRAFGAMQRGGYGYSRGGFPNKRANSRDRNYGGRGPNKWEQEYFESCFRKQPKTQPTSESEADESNDENHDDEQTVNDKKKQVEDPNKSNECANEHELTEEMKAVVVTDTVMVAVTPPASITPSVPITSSTPATDAADVEADKSTNSNADKNAA